MISSLDKCDEFAKATNENEPVSFHVHYLWLKNSNFDEAVTDECLLCDIPLEQIDRIIGNARKYPEIDFSIWIDPSDYQNGYTAFLVQSHSFLSGCSNIKVRNIHEVESYSALKEFEKINSAKMIFWHRVDLVRLLLIQDQIQDSSYSKIQIYSDMDVQDIFGFNGALKNKLSQGIKKYGFCCGATCKDNLLENGYLAVSSNMRGKNFIDYIIGYIKQKYAYALAECKNARNIVYGLYFDSVTSYMLENGIAIENAMLPILSETFTQIPHDPRYEGISHRHPFFA